MRNRLGERKGVNKYYPPDFDPSKGSLNTWRGQHPLRDRARKIHQGILVIRFEMPYNIWCDGCNNHIGMGVRYNAEKSKVGNYYTTPIYKFRMKCHLCDNHFEIQTDPKNHDYVILEGARRKEQRWDPRENEQIVPEDKATQKKLATDPMYKLEHGSDDQQRGKSAVMSLSQIAGMRDSWQDDYILNKMARNKFRNEKKQIALTKAADKALLDKSSLDIELVPETEDDKKLAGLIKYSVTKSFDEKQMEKRKAIENRPFFPQQSSTSSAVILPGQLGPHSRRAEIKRKLGLHLNSPKVEHRLADSKLQGLVRKNTKTEHTSEPDNSSGSAEEKPAPSVESARTCDQSADDSHGSKTCEEKSSDSTLAQTNASSDVSEGHALSALMATYTASESDSSDTS
ncbi:hypothetical protein BaRGS_00006652 [Batillaria attramentaria]|uniref:Coiled-coil domain-containing protein 130 n=1 Tax=Batillaria attramentaria TaxID=370345 RepID=A0ABD0LT03_9CAEN